MDGQVILESQLSGGVSVDGNLGGSIGIDGSLSGAVESGSGVKGIIFIDSKLSGDISVDGSLSAEMEIQAQLSGQLDPGGGSFPPYPGPYEVTPLVESDQSLDTSGHRMLDDVTVFKVPTYEVSGPTGGITLIIGGDG